MTQSPPPSNGPPNEPPEITDLIGYADLTQDAFRGVMRKVLKGVVDNGLPENHHFYISFLTQAPGVDIHQSLIEKYPNDMTIVLQNQYRDLRVTDDTLSVTLSFGGVPRILNIAFSAIYLFHDPYAQFRLEFDVTAYDDDPDDEIEDDSYLSAEIPADNEIDSSKKVVSLDHFRKK
jgi:hypothetical protein